MWNENSDPDKDPPDWTEESRSYHLFFLSPLDELFEMKTETVCPDEDGVERTIPGEGRIGCMAAVSLVAPFAVVRLDEMEVFEDGSRTNPDVEPHIFDLSFRTRNMEKHYGEIYDPDELDILRNLRAEIIRVLEGFEIAVIGDDDLDKQLPWLRASEEVSLAHSVKNITVQDAFFLRGR